MYVCTGSAPLTGKLSNLLPKTTWEGLGVKNLKFCQGIFLDLSVEPPSYFLLEIWVPWGKDIFSCSVGGDFTYFAHFTHQENTLLSVYIQMSSKKWAEILRQSHDRFSVNEAAGRLFTEWVIIHALK